MLELLEASFLWIGAHFTAEVYLFSSKLQGMLWSAADIVLVLALLKIADFVRHRSGEKKIALRYLFLWLSALITPLMFFAQSPQQFFLLEAAICGMQFLILVYTVVAERKRMVAVMRKELHIG
jgi:peptidoglycan/LPS O-acetylase OafA/YrhL